MVYAARHHRHSQIGSKGPNGGELDIFSFELTQEDMDAIRELDTATSLFFDHRDPAMVKLLSEAKRNT